MRAATKFKWDAYVGQRITRRRYYYTMHFLLAAIALLISTQMAAEQVTDVDQSAEWNGWNWSSINKGVADWWPMMC